MVPCDVFLLHDSATVNLSFHKTDDDDPTHRSTVSDIAYADFDAAQESMQTRFIRYGEQLRSMVKQAMAVDGVPLSDDKYKRLCADGIVNEFTRTPEESLGEDCHVKISWKIKEETFTASRYLWIQYVELV